MGSNETATTTTGGPRVIAYLTGTGCHRAQIIYFFRWQICSRTPSGTNLGSGSRLDRMRWFLGLSRELWIEIFGKSWSRAKERKGPCLYVCIDGSAHACGVGDCTSIVRTLGDPRETSGPRIDRFHWRDHPGPPARNPRKHAIGATVAAMAPRRSRSQTTIS